MRTNCEFFCLQVTVVSFVITLVNFYPSMPHPWRRKEIKSPEDYTRFNILPSRYTISTPPSTTGALQVVCRISSNLRCSRKGWFFRRRIRATQGMFNHKNFSRRALWYTFTRTHLEGYRSVDLSNHSLQLCPRAPRPGVFVGIWRLPIGTDTVPHATGLVKNVKPVWWMVEKRGHGDFSSLLQP